MTSLPTTSAEQVGLTPVLRSDEDPANTPRSPQIPRTELLRQQEDRRGDQEVGPAQGLHFDPDRFGMGYGAGYDSDSRHDQAATSGGELCVGGCRVDGRGEGGDAEDH